MIKHRKSSWCRVQTGRNHHKKNSSQMHRRSVPLTALFCDFNIKRHSTDVSHAVWMHRTAASTAQICQTLTDVIHKPPHILSTFMCLIWNSNKIHFHVQINIEHFFPQKVFNCTADSLRPCIMSSGWPAVLCPGLFLEAPHNNSRIITPQNDEETSKRALWLHPFSSQTSFKALASCFLTARDDRMKQIDSWRVLGQLTNDVIVLQLY